MTLGQGTKGTAAVDFPLLAFRSPVHPGRMRKKTYTPKPSLLNWSDLKSDFRQREIPLFRRMFEWRYSSGYFSGCGKTENGRYYCGKQGETGFCRREWLWWGEERRTRRSNCRLIGSVGQLGTHSAARKRVREWKGFRFVNWCREIIGLISLEGLTVSALLFVSCRSTVRYIGVHQQGGRGRKCMRINEGKWGQ